MLSRNGTGLQRSARSLGSRWLYGLGGAVAIVAAVWILLLEEPPGHSTTAGHDGALELELEPAAARAPMLRGRSLPLENHVSTTPVPPSGAAATFEVLVVDEVGNPVPEAILTLLQEPAHQLSLGRSDGEGRVLAPSEAVKAGDVLVASHRDYALATQAIGGSGAPTAVRIVLGVGAVISGALQLPDGGAPRLPISVLAEPRDELSPESEGTFGVEDPRLAGTTADPSGRFELHGLRPNQAYRLSAGGSGWVTTCPLEARAGERDVRLMVRPLYGLILCLTEEDGSPLSVSPHLGQIGVSAWECTKTPPGAYPVSDLALAARLAGTQRWPDLPEFATCASRVVLLFTLPNEVEKLGPVRCAIRKPTYQPLQVEVYLERATESIPVVPIALAPEVSCARTRVLLHFSPPYVPPDLPRGRAKSVDSSHTDYLGYFELVNESRWRLAHGLRASAAARGQLEICGLPVGTWSVRFVPAAWKASDRETIGVQYVLLESEPQEFHVRLPAMACVHLQPPFGGERPPWFLRAVVLESDADRILVRELIEESSELTIHGLKPGCYRVRLVAPDDALLLDDPVTVREGEVVRLPREP